MVPVLVVVGGLVAAELAVTAGRRAWRRAKRVPVAASRTTPPGRHVVLYDGHCKFCQAQTKNLLALAQPGAIELLSFQDPGALDRFPGVSFDACMRAMHLVTPSGHVYEGFAAAAHAVATRPGIGLLAYGYYLPGVHLICDAIYAAIAANRYRILGKQIAAGECDGACELHFGPKK